MYVIRNLSPRTGMPLHFFGPLGWGNSGFRYHTYYEAELVQRVIHMYEPDVRTVIIEPPPGDDA